MMPAPKAGSRSLRHLPLLVLLGALAAAVASMLNSFVRQSVYPAPSVPVPSPPPAPLEEVRLRLPSGDEVVGWAWTAPSPEAPVLLYFHGNGENLETLRWAGLYEELSALGASFLALDYPGYGRSTGSPSEAGLLAAGEAALTWAGERYPQAPTVPCGWSLGAAVAIHLAAEHPEAVSGLIAMSSWTSLHDVASILFPRLLIQALVSERYDSLAKAPRVRCPALVIHGRRDFIIPFRQGEKVAGALGGASRFVAVPQAGHNDLLGQSQVWREIAAFLRDLRPVG